MKFAKKVPKNKQFRIRKKFLYFPYISPTLNNIKTTLWLQRVFILEQYNKVWGWQNIEGYINIVDLFSEEIYICSDKVNIYNYKNYNELLESGNIIDKQLAIDIITNNNETNKFIFEKHNL